MKWVALIGVIWAGAAVLVAVFVHAADERRRRDEHLIASGIARAESWANHPANRGGVS